MKPGSGLTVTGEPMAGTTVAPPGLSGHVHRGHQEAQRLGEATPTRPLSLLIWGRILSRVFGSLTKFHPNFPLSVSGEAPS